MPTIKSSWYKRRARSLRRLGFAEYSEYLRSSRWVAIRRMVLERCKSVCEVCHARPATQVHHRSYCLDAMMGKRLDFLVGCCRPCHVDAEFDGNRKTRPSEANTRMGAAATSLGYTLFGLCTVCKKNPTRPGKTVCRKCRRLNAHRSG